MKRRTEYRDENVIPQVFAINLVRPHHPARICEVCGHLDAERHHLLTFAVYGETGEQTVAYLCPNCHRRYHQIDRLLPGFLWTLHSELTPRDAWHPIAVIKVNLQATSRHHELLQIVYEFRSLHGTHALSRLLALMWRSSVLEGKMSHAMQMNLVSVAPELTDTANMASVQLEILQNTSRIRLGDLKALRSVVSFDVPDVEVPA